MGERECSSGFIKKFDRKVSKIYSDSHLQRLARETGFSQRASKFTPQMFCDTVVYREIAGDKMSLNDHGVAIMHRYGVEIKKQSIDERFNQSAVDLLKELLKQQLESQLVGAIERKGLGPLLAQFSAVKVKDSTRFQVPGNLKDAYPGVGGGSTSEAGVHVQFEFDLLSGKVCDLGFTNAKYQDNTDAKETLDSIQSGELILRDLGYFSFQSLKYIHDKGAYFITRRPSSMVLFHSGSDKRINYNVLYNQLKHSRVDTMDIPVCTTQGQFMRLIVERLPKKQFAERMARAKEAARKKGRKITHAYKSRARLNLFLTNIPSKRIPAKQVRKIYSLRWQIELCFKAWKSFYHLDAHKPVKQHRFECYLYGTLLLVMINWEIATGFSCILQKYHGRPLSILKFFKATSQTICWLSQATREGGDRLINYLVNLYRASKHLLIEERKHHQTKTVK